MNRDDLDFGPDTERIRAWLAKRATYADPQAAVPAGRHGEREQVPLVERAQTRAPQGATRAAGPGPAATAAGPERVAPDPVGSGRSTNVVFEPRTGVRRAMSLILLLVAAGTAAAGGYAAYRPSGESVGVAVIALVLTLVVWAVRAGTTVTELAVIRGQLEVIRGGRFEVVDLGSPYTPVAVIGRPGARRWRVLIERTDEPLLVLDRSMVDPHRFTEVLHRLRPDLRLGPGDTGQVAGQATSIQ